MIVVSNTSPIINLAAVGQLQLLRQLYGQITIPQAVYREIVILGWTAWCCSSRVIRLDRDASGL